MEQRYLIRTSTLVTIDPKEIMSVSTKNGVVLSYWSAKIQSQEYVHLISIIINYKLIGTGSCWK